MRDDTDEYQDPETSGTPEAPVVLPGSELSDLPSAEERPEAARPPQGVPSVPRGHKYPGVERPIVFVPGIMGSALVRTNTAQSLWPPYSVNGLGQFEFLSHIKDLYRPVPKVAREFPLIYVALLPTLEGLRGAQNFYPFWYDWTQKNRTSGAQLASFIDEILRKPQYAQFDQVDLVCHSMGGIVSRSAMVHSGALNKIRRKVYLASPHYGAPKAYFAYHPGIENQVFSGFFMNLVGDLAWKLLVRGPHDESTVDAAIEDLALKIDSVPELLPDDFYLDTVSMLTDDRPAQSRAILSTGNTYFHNDWKFPTKLHGKIRDALAFKRSLGRDLPGAANDSLVLYSNSIETPDRISFDHIWPGYEFEEIDSTSERNGDGTVPVPSASLKGSHSNTRTVQGEHVALPNSAETLYLVQQFLQA